MGVVVIPPFCLELEVVIIVAITHVDEFRDGLLAELAWHEDKMKARVQIMPGTRPHAMVAEYLMHLMKNPSFSVVSYIQPCPSC